MASNNNLGGEIKVYSTLLETFSEQNRYYCSIFQIHLPTAHPKNPYTFQKFTSSDLAQSRLYAINHSLRFYIHTPFATNISKTDSEKSIKLLLSESKMFENFDCGLVMHIGKVGKLETVIQNLNAKVIPNLSTNLLLENAAGQGTELGRAIDEFRRLFEGIDDLSKIRLCLDTQHLFASGICQFDSAESVVKLLDDYWEATGQYPKLIHLNDSAKPFNSHVDRHQNIGQGYIWSENRDSLQELLRLSQELSIDLILETPDVYRDLKFLHKL